MMNGLSVEAWQQKIQDAASLEDLDLIRVELLGKNGAITAQLKALSQLDENEKKEKGRILNEIKGSLISSIQSRKEQLELAILTKQLESEKMDLSLPEIPYQGGKIHPISQVIQDITTYFAQFGFTVATGPDLEDDEYNFTALNIPENHPARNMHDTFYMANVEKLLRTHTSPVQIRTMLQKGAPIRILAPGRVYRSDDDATHSPMFHQIEGLMIEEIGSPDHIHFGHLKGCLVNFCRSFFATEDLPVRFRPSYFPFTEPSAEVDIGCERTAKGITIGKGASWMEILGCGMVHPNVLRHCGIDPERYQGFAFGIGMERLAMLKYAIPDLRAMFENDVRWIKNVGLSAITGLQ